MGPGSTQLLVACGTEYAATSNKKLGGGGYYLTFKCIWSWTNQCWFSYGGLEIEHWLVTLLSCVSYILTELRGVVFNNEGNHYGNKGNHYGYQRTSMTTLASIDWCIDWWPSVIMWLSLVANPVPATFPRVGDINLNGWEVSGSSCSNSIGSCFGSS